MGSLYVSACRAQVVVAGTGGSLALEDCQVIAHARPAGQRLDAAVLCMDQGSSVSLQGSSVEVRPCVG